MTNLIEFIEGFSTDLQQFFEEEYGLSSYISPLVNRNKKEIQIQGPYIKFDNISKLEVYFDVVKINSESPTCASILLSYDNHRKIPDKFLKYIRNCEGVEFARHEEI